MLVSIQSLFVHINLFADDIVIWASEVLINMHPMLIMFHMQQTLNALATWASTWKITFSSTKTQMIIFFIGATLPSTWNSFKLTLSHFTIVVVDTYTYLGLILHKQLDWTTHIREIIRKATATSHHIARLAFFRVQSRPSLPVIRQLINTVLLPKITYGLPFISLFADENHPLMLQLKRLLIIPLRRSLGLPHNAHHDSIFIESRTLPIPCTQLHHSLLLAKRWIKQGTTQQQQQQQRFDFIFHPDPHSNDNIQYTNPLNCIAMQCNLILTTTFTRFQGMTSQQLWDHVFKCFYHTWYTSQHPSTRRREKDTHSLFTCYKLFPVLRDTTLPSYFHLLSPSDASVISRLRFNRARLNQSLHYRHVLTTDKCPTCPDVRETVEHVVMSCPRYDAIRFKCFHRLASITNKPPLSSSFAFPFLLCSFPPNTHTTHCNQYIRIISSFHSSMRQMRDF